jgi:hypothetical protein
MNIDRVGRLVLTGLKYVPENLGPDVRGGDVIFNNTNSRELVGKAAAVPELPANAIPHTL